jgi:outer membrane protein assembly factor BamB
LIRRRFILLSGLGLGTVAAATTLRLTRDTSPPPNAGFVSPSEVPPPAAGSVWQVQIPVTPDVPPLADDEHGTLIVPRLGGAITALDTASGDVRWNHPGEPVSYRSAAVTGDHLILGASDAQGRFNAPAKYTRGGITALHRATGAVVWHYRTSREPRLQVDAVRGALVALDHAGWLTSLQAGNGRVRWQVRPSDPIAETGERHLAIQGDTVLATYRWGRAGAESERLIAVSAADGRLRWQTDSGTNRRFGGLVASEHGHAYIRHSIVAVAPGDSPSAATLLAIDLTSGEQVWTYEAATVGDRLVLASDYLYLTSSDDRAGPDWLRAIDVRNGATRWSHRFEATHASHSTKALLTDADTLLVGGPAGLLALHRHTGARRWTATPDPNVTLLGDPQVSGGLVYARCNLLDGGGVLRWQLADGSSLPALWPDIVGVGLTISGRRLHLASENAIVSMTA